MFHAELDRAAVAAYPDSRSHTDTPPHRTTATAGDPLTIVVEGSSGFGGPFAYGIQYQQPMSALSLLGLPATQSSSGGYAASLALDGVADTAFAHGHCAATLGGVPGTWSVTLPRRAYVARVTLTLPDGVAPGGRAPQPGQRRNF